MPDTVLTKLCRGCDRVLPTDQFHRNKNTKDQCAHRCKVCACANSREHRSRNIERYREYMRQWHEDNRGRKYGLTRQGYEDLVESSGGVCSLCGRPPTGKRDRLMVDHDHVTGQVRSMLCHSCNTGIGLLGDDPDVLERAAAYIRAHRVGA